MKILTEDDALSLLHIAIQAMGSQHAFAREHNVAESYLSDVLNSKHGLTDRVLTLIGCKWVIVMEADNDRS